ncbi:MAG: hypothetical protein ACO1RX_07240 [Candidatus Sericytochromatia bacterium]
MIYDLVLNNVQKVTSPGWQERLRDHDEASRLLLETLSTLWSWIPNWLFWSVLGGGLVFFAYAWLIQTGYKTCLQFQVRWLDTLPPAFESWTQSHHQPFLDAGFIWLGDVWLEGLHPYLQYYSRLYVHPEHPEIIGSASAFLKPGSSRLFQNVLSISSFDAHGPVLTATSMKRKYTDLLSSLIYSAPKANPGQLFQLWQSHHRPVTSPGLPVERNTYADIERKALQETLDKWVERGLAWYQPDDQEYLLTARGARYIVLKSVLPSGWFWSRPQQERITSKGPADWVSQL